MKRLELLVEPEYQQDEDIIRLKPDEQGFSLVSQMLAFCQQNKIVDKCYVLHDDGDGDDYILTCCMSEIENEYKRGEAWEDLSWM